MGDRREGRALFRIAAALALSLAPGPAPASAADGDAEVRRTWERAEVMVDLGGRNFISGRMDEAETRAALARLPGRLPTVVYIHGCSGLTEGNYTYAFLLARAGYTVIMPNSFARSFRPQTCDPRRHRGIPGAPFRLIAEMRQEEVRHAARMARTLPWVDPENLFLMGHSQGGTTAAAYEGDDFKARVVSGSRCWRGFRAPPATPVLSIIAERDPWLRGRSPRGCQERAARRGAPIEFHLFDDDRHNLSGHPVARKLILDFLARHTRRRP